MSMFNKDKNQDKKTAPAKPGPTGQKRSDGQDQAKPVAAHNKK